MALTDNLVSYYKLDESSGNAADIVGSRTLTNTNTVTFNTGVINNGAYFASASNQYLINTSTSVSAGGNMSAQTWVWFTTTPSDAVPQCLMMQGYDGNVARAFVCYVETAINFSLSGTGSGGNTKTIAWSPSTSTWYHFVWVYTALAGTVDIYVNTSHLTQATGFNTSMFTGNGKLALGGDTFTGDSLNGRMDEVGFWQRALTTQEISQLYNNGAGLAYPLTIPVTWSVAFV